jgi:2-hydroxycyclohexanecarboxyl-CoA dehydrogenase
MRGLKRKLAVVTGGGGGIGRAICRRFAEDGAVVAVFDINGEGAAGTASAIAAAGGTALPVTVDITDRDAVNAAVATLEAETGPIEILVNNAGWDKLGNFLATGPELWEKIVAINLWGPLYMHHAVVKRMAERRRGRVVNIASDAGRVGSSGEAVYSFCKGGLIAFSKTLARELARPQITVNVVCPGPTDTPLLATFLEEGEQGRRIHEALQHAIPFRRLGRPEDVPGIVAFLASDEASFITGQVISVSGGLTMHG